MQHKEAVWYWRQSGSCIMDAQTFYVDLLCYLSPIHQLRISGHVMQASDTNLMYLILRYLVLVHMMSQDVPRPQTMCQKSKKSQVTYVTSTLRMLRVRYANGFDATL